MFTFFKLAQQYSALQEEECLHVQPINTPLEYCRHVTHDVFWLKVKRRSETSKPRFHFPLWVHCFSICFFPSTYAFEGGEVKRDVPSDKCLST